MSAPTWEAVIFATLQDKGISRPRAGQITVVLQSALSAAGYAVEQGWQPIETAPKDGRRLLCYAPATEDRAAVVRNDYWWVGESAWAHMPRVHPYTHWRPLPAAPEAPR